MKLYYHYKQAIKDLFENGEKELWIVRAFTENNVAGQEVFTIYRTGEDAKAYIKRVKDFYKASPFHEYLEDRGNDAFTFRDRGGYTGIMLQHFEVIHERAA